MDNWYSADLHFGHHRIIDFCKRPALLQNLSR